MNFSDYAKAKKTAEKLTPEAKDVLSNFLSTYNGKSQAELMETIERLAMEGRANGSLTDSDLDNFYNMISPMLKEEEKKRLFEVKEKLKEK